MKRGDPKFTTSSPFLGLRVKVSLGVFLPLIFVLGLFMLVQYETQQREILNNLALIASQTGLTIQNSLEFAMLNHNQEELQHILDAVGKNQSLRIVYLLDNSGRVVFAPGGQGVGTTLDNRDSTCQPCHSLPPAQRPASIVVTLANGQRVFRTMNPILNPAKCQGCHDASLRLNGVLLTDISMTPLEASLRQSLWQNLLWWSAAVLVALVIVNLVVERFVLRRLGKILMAIHDLGLGKRAAPLSDKYSDEVSQVSLAFNAMAQQIEKRIAENEQLSEDLHRQNIERGDLLGQVIRAQEDERARMARDLHDELGQALAGLSLRTEAVKKLVSSNPQQALVVLADTQSLVQLATEQMYNLILDLRPSVLDDMGLVVALKMQAERTLKNAGVAYQLDASGLSERLPPEIETALFRIFQEAMNNVVRHAQASFVWMTLSSEDDVFRGEIADDGQGFDYDGIRAHPNGTQGLGLLGMQERVMKYQGKIEVVSNVQAGTKIVITVPCRRQ